MTSAVPVSPRAKRDTRQRATGFDARLRDADACRNQLRVRGGVTPCGLGEGGPGGRSFFALVEDLALAGQEQDFLTCLPGTVEVHRAADGHRRVETHLEIVALDETPSVTSGRCLGG